MRRLALIGCLLAVAFRGWCQTDAFESAADAVANMRLGWNLGNTLESNSGDTLNMWIERWSQRLPANYETAWGQPQATPKLMKMMHDAGFNAIRVPVTWYPHMEARFNFNGNSTVWTPSADDIGTQVQAAWMKRVHQVVDYVIGQGMYCILNVHHDTGASNTAWLIADEQDYARQKLRFEALWTQIAEKFRDYGDHLLFEGYNEMLDVKRSWCFASFAADGRYNAAIATSAYNAINAYAQSFVSAVRATGGNNAQRNLIVSTYGACDGRGNWSTHLQDPLKKMVLPDDPAGKGHLIFEVHSYPELNNLTAAKSELQATLRNLQNNLVAKGAPVIFGEWGESTGKAYDENRANLLAFARYFVEQCKAKGFGTFYWMGLTDGTHRSVPEFSQPELVEALAKGYYGEEGYQSNITAPQTSAGSSPKVTVYDLQGRICRSGTSGPDVFSGLPNGIYIVQDRRKLRIKN